MQFRFCNGRFMDVYGAQSLTTVDTTADKTLKVTAQWGGAVATDIITSKNIVVEMLR